IWKVVSLTVPGLSGIWNGIRTAIPGSTSMAPLPGEMALMLIHSLSRSAFTVIGNAAVSLAPPREIVAIIVTIASLSAGTVTPPELVMTVGLLDVQEIVLPFAALVGRKMLPVTLESESPGP